MARTPLLRRSPWGSLLVAVVVGCTAPGAPAPPSVPALTTASSPATQPSPTARATVARKPVIVIDPGHSGHSIRSTSHGLRDIDYPNYPEI